LPVTPNCAAPAQMRELEGVLIDRLLLLKFGEFDLLAQILARFGATRGHTSRAIVPTLP
jgi:hypothetical protein